MQLLSKNNDCELISSFNSRYPNKYSDVYLGRAIPDHPLTTSLFAKRKSINVHVVQNLSDLSVLTIRPLAVCVQWIYSKMFVVTNISITILPKHVIGRATAFNFLVILYIVFTRGSTNITT